MRRPETDVCGRVSDRVNMRTDRVLYISLNGKRKWTGGGRGGQVPEREIALGMWDGCTVEAYRGDTVASRVLIKTGRIEKWIDTGDAWHGEVK